MQVMEWDRLLSTKRLGLESRTGSKSVDQRSHFQRDYDRIIFSSPFRRLQNKTQVFPLPGSVFVHNRLTHSLEVASVGRSLGDLISNYLIEDRGYSSNPLIPEIGSIVATACLAHDLGNPPFGHSGEAAISNFFTNGKGSRFEKEMSESEWSDFTRFDGNPNALRLLSHKFEGRRDGGFALTYSSLASVVKYPFESHLATKPKFGFFQSDRDTFIKVANELGLIKDAEAKGVAYFRHPLVYLVEAADDICYQIMDIEDAFKLKIISYERSKELLLAFFKGDDSQLKRLDDILLEVTDHNEQIGLLRANVIGKMVKEVVEIFKSNYDDIMRGCFKSSLIDTLPSPSSEAMLVIRELSAKDIYEDKRVVEIEIAGYQILGTLIEEFTDAIFADRSVYQSKMLSLVPSQYKPDGDTTYAKIQSIVDFVTGMTDVYALDLFRKIKGITVPQLL